MCYKIKFNNNLLRTYRRINRLTCMALAVSLEVPNSILWQRPGNEVDAGPLRCGNMVPKITSLVTIVH